MEKYVINYHTGVTEEVEVSNVNEAKEIAKQGIAYTQEKITIENLDGDVITTSLWYGVNPEDDDNVLEVVGNGFYEEWTD